jgi:hypothetical protein
MIQRSFCIVQNERTIGQQIIGISLSAACTLLGAKPAYRCLEGPFSSNEEHI